MTDCNLQSQRGRLVQFLGSLVALAFSLALAACGSQETPLPPTGIAAPMPSQTLPIASASVSSLTPASYTTPPAARTATATPRKLPALVATTPVAPTALLTAMRLPERTTYALSATLDYARHQLIVTQTVTYTNLTTATLSDLVLVVEANRAQGVFSLLDLNWSDGTKVAGYSLEGARLQIPLPEVRQSERSIGLMLFYQVDLPARPAPLGYSGRQVNLGDWYPFVPPYRAGQGWLVHEPGAVGEHLVYDVADYRVDLRLVGDRTDLVIAASAPAEEGDGDQFIYQMAGARSFALSASPEYVILAELAGPVEVTAYVFPEHRVAGQAALAATSSALTLFSRLFAPYPHASLAIVEADFADGMEYDGLYFLGREYFAAYDGTPQNYLTTLAAHETAHQWCYGLVGSDQALEPWLDEALSTYSELLFSEAVDPGLAAWWWDFRVNRFQPVGWVDSSIYDHQAFRPYVDAVYLRGAQFLQAVRDANRWVIRGCVSCSKCTQCVSRKIKQKPRISSLSYTRSERRTFQSVSIFGVSA